MEQQIIDILHFEDNPNDVILTGYLLEEANDYIYRVRHADRLSMGLEHLATESPGIILLDLNLPDSHGLSTFEAVKKVAGTVPIIIMSGLTAKELAVNAVQEGAQDYLIKGQINSQLLIRSILYGIERQKLRVRLEEALEKVRTLEGLLPICCYCKNIRDERGFWFSIETYIHNHSNAKFSHGICPNCLTEHYPGLKNSKNEEQ